MFSAYLVDDEALILEELIRTIPWMDNGFEVIGSNTNPRIAHIEIKCLHPDVVFCDLKMIGMDGNELIKALKEDGIDCEFVMISAYDNFESVRAFFQQSGFDYVLKPIQMEDIQMVLEKLASRLRQNHQEYPELKDAGDHSYFDGIIAYIDENFASKITLEILAKHFGYSRNYICNIFSKYYNTTLTCYLTEKRMEHAKNLLKDKNNMLKNIANDCGYREYGHFYKVFKEYYGIAPKEMMDRL